MITYFILLKF